MPVATKTSVKYISPEDLHTMGAKAIISNSLDLGSSGIICCSKPLRAEAITTILVMRQCTGRWKETQ